MTDSELERLIGYMDLYHMYRSKEESDLGAKESAVHFATVVCEFAGCGEIMDKGRVWQAMETSKKRHL